MKKLKFFALALVAGFGFAACGDDEDEVAFCSKDAETTTDVCVMGGAGSQKGSFYTFDKGVQTKGELGETATNVIFCFSTLDETYNFISGTESKNGIVAAQASVTKFAEIKEASVEKASKLNESDFKDTKIEFSSKVENGKRAVAFLNDKAKGFFEINSYDAASTDMSITVYLIKEDALIRAN